MLRILLTGGTGQIGSELRNTLSSLGEVLAPGRSRMNLEYPDSIRSAIREAKPGIIVNAAAFAAMDPAEANPELALQVNGIGPGIIAEEAKRLGVLLVHYSTAYVFDGKAARAYVEDDPPNPINAYGKSKLAGEKAILATGAAHVILRLSWVYSLRGSNFLTAFLKVAREKEAVPVVDDQTGAPTWARTVAEATAHIVAGWRPAGGATGTFHLSAAGMVTRCGFAKEVITASGSAAGDGALRAKVRPIASAEYPLPAMRPKYCVLDNTKAKRAFGIEMPDWKEQLRACMAQGPADL